MGAVTKIPPFSRGFFAWSNTTKTQQLLENKRLESMKVIVYRANSLVLLFMTFTTTLHCEGHIVHFAAGRGNKDSMGGGEGE